MKAAFYTGAAGLRAQQQAMDTIGQNIANVNTNAYQPTQLSFSTLLSTEMNVNTPTNPRTGFGVKVENSGLTIGAGAFQSTGRDLDFAVGGYGFFAVEQDNQVQYTRDGCFTIMLDNDDAYLGTQDGAYVLDDNGDRIELEHGEDNEIYQLGELKEQIGVYLFENPEALNPISNNRYLENELSGDVAAMDSEDNGIIQGSLEGSGTSITDEMAKLIGVQRAFQLSARVVKAADENEQTIHGLRR